MKTLSIIIPIYNVEEYLAECLDSVVNVDDIEIILVNDCTPDDSMEIAESYVKKYDNISLIHHDVNKGLGAARNTGIENASGKYIFFLDSDDYLDTYELNLLVKKLEKIEYEQVLISFLRFDSQKGKWPQSHKNFYIKNDGKVLDRNNFSDLVAIVNLSQLRVIKREKILSDNIRFPDGIYEDILWSYWFSYSCESILVLDNKMYLYRQRTESILSTTSETHMDLSEQYKKTINFFQSRSASPKAITILKDEFLIHAEYILFKTERLPQNLKLDFYKQSIKYLEAERSKEIKQQQKQINDLKKIKQEQQAQINDLKKIEQQQQILLKSIKEIMNYPIRKYPIKKYYAYKEMLSLYQQIKKQN